MFSYSLLSTHKKFVELRQSRKLVLFGAGRVAQKEINECFRWDDVVFVWDNDVKLHGKRICDFIVSPPPCEAAECINFDDEYIVVVLIHYDDKITKIDITAQLQSLGINNIFYYDSLSLNKNMRFDFDTSKMFHECNTYRQIEANKDKIAFVRSILSDEKSVSVYDAIIDKVKYNVSYYTEISDDAFNPYFDQDFFTFSDRETFVDGGAHYGESTIQFAQSIEMEKLVHSIAFEPDAQNFAKCAANFAKYLGEPENANHENGSLYCDKYTLFKLGLWNENTILRYARIGQNGEGTRFVNDNVQLGYDMVASNKLDNIIDTSIKVTYIKLDVEGAEYQALSGAKQVILRNKPKLAVCGYHRVEDVWSLPLLIHSILPEYKIYIRQHSRAANERIFYACV